MPVDKLNLSSFIFSSAIADRMEQITHPLKESGIVHFGYARILPNGKMLRLSNNEHWTVKFFENQFYNDIDLFDFQKIPFDTYYYKTLVGAPSNNHYRALCEHGIWNCFIIYKKNVEYGELWFFAGSCENTSVLDFCFNQLDFLKEYISYFTLEASPWIEDKDPYRFISLDKRVFENNKGAAFDATFDFIKNNKRFFLTKTPSAKLSRRELECLFYLKKGRTMKEISNYLRISPRTVEFYIQNMKIKIGCNTKSQLINYNEVVNCLSTKC